MNFSSFGGSPDFRAETNASAFGKDLAFLTWRGGAMLGVHIENVGDVAVIECDGRIVQSDAAFAIRDAVMSQERAHVIVLDLSEVDAIAGGGLGMLVFLQRWSYDHHIRLKMFNPSWSVRNTLENASSISPLEIATLDEVVALLARADSRYALDCSRLSM